LYEYNGTSFKPILEFAKISRARAISEVDKGKKLLTFFKQTLDTLIEPFWYDGDMLEGKCPKCGAYYHGWALLNPRHQSCPRCGVGLEITQDGRRVFIGYSPFTGQRYFIDSHTDVAPPHDKEKGSRVQNE
jgi:hypothetical protein